MKTSLSALRKRLGPISDEEFGELVRPLVRDLCEESWREVGRLLLPDFETRMMEKVRAAVGNEAREEAREEAQLPQPSPLAAVAAKPTEVSGEGSAPAVGSDARPIREEECAPQSERQIPKAMVPAIMKPPLNDALRKAAEAQRRSQQIADGARTAVVVSHAPEVFDVIGAYHTARESQASSGARLQFEGRYGARRFTLENAGDLVDNEARGTTVIKARYAEAPFGEYLVLYVRQHTYCFPYWDLPLADFWKRAYLRELFELEEPMPTQPRLIKPAVVGTDKAEWVCYRKGRIGRE